MSGALAFGGWAVWPLFGLSVPGLVLGVLALGLSDKRYRHYVGLAALAISTALSVMAILGALSVRGHAADVAAPHSEIAAVRAQRATLIHARVPLRIGLAGALIPLLGGITGALSIHRNRKGKPASMRSLRAPVAPAGNVKIAMAASGVAGSAAAVAAILLLIPLPGPSLPLESPAWLTLEAIEQMKSGHSAEGCHALGEASKKGGADPRLVPDLASAVSLCFDLGLDEAQAVSPDTGALVLENLDRSGLPLTQEQRGRIKTELANMRSSTAQSPEQ